MEQEKERRRKKNEHKQIEPFNRDIDEHEMHLKHKERKQQTEMHNFLLSNSTKVNQSGNTCITHERFMSQCLS